jgi:hypothetical protein
MKRGLIYTLYKGSRKYEDDRKNYRGISLMPVLAKIFEKLILNRIKAWVSQNNIAFPSSNQNAYQESLCSLLASFQYQECIYYNMERDSKVYVGLLDASSAFDCVWHAGLFYKLHKFGIKGKLWRVLYVSYQNMSSNVVLNGMLSNYILVQRSVRQGSILGPWYYMLFIHDLAMSLQNSSHGAKIGNVSCGAVLQADDIALVALTAQSLQELISLCEQYSVTWRFRYNHTKAKALVFGESARRKNALKCGRAFTLYHNAIEELDSYTHVGVNLSVYFNTKQRIDDAVTKMRSTLMAIIGSGVKLSHMSCITAIKLYKCIVLPRAMYGVELWSQNTAQDLAKLERAHNFCLKAIQTFPVRTKSVINHCMVNLYCLETYMDLKKLIFFGRLCLLCKYGLAKSAFLERLYQYHYVTSTFKCQLGFLPDVMRVISKYNMCHYASEYVNHCVFPSKTLCF